MALSLAFEVFNCFLVENYLEYIKVLVRTITGIFKRPI